MAKKKGKVPVEEDVVYDEAEDEQDKKEWVEEKQPDEPGETYAQMPENKPGKPPPRPEDQEPAPPNSDLSPNAAPEKE